MLLSRQVLRAFFCHSTALVRIATKINCNLYNNFDRCSFMLCNILYRFSNGQKGGGILHEYKVPRITGRGGKDGAGNVVVCHAFGESSPIIGLWTIDKYRLHSWPLSGETPVSLPH